MREGGRGATVWDSFAHTPGKIDGGDNGDVADDVYHRFDEDMGLVTGLGINAYRFSIAWSRILPSGEGAVANEEGLQYYNNVIDRLLEAEVTPVVTLFHWDTPLALEEKYGGWLNEDMETRKCPPRLLCSCRNGASLLRRHRFLQLRRPLFPAVWRSRKALDHHQRAHVRGPQWIFLWSTRPRPLLRLQRRGLLY